MNVALKSKKGSDSIVSPNRYAILSESSSTDHVTPPISANIYTFPRKPDSSKLAPWAKEHAEMHSHREYQNIKSVYRTFYRQSK